MGWPDDPTPCTVHRAKITEYLLNLDHAHGAAKAKFFLAFVTAVPSKGRSGPDGGPVAGA